MRLERDLQGLGIERGAAGAAVRDVLAETDERTLARQALARRWRRAGRPEPADAARLYRALLRQGFGPSAARAALTALGAPDDTLDDGPAADDPSEIRHERFSLTRRSTEGGEAPVQPKRRPRISGIFEEGATQPDGMHRRPNAGGSVRCVHNVG